MIVCAMPCFESGFRLMGQVDDSRRVAEVLRERGVHAWSLERYTAADRAAVLGAHGQW